MARNRKGRSLFDVEDSDQQVLPFDFIEDDDEGQNSLEQPAATVDESSVDDKKDSKEASVGTERESPSATLKDVTDKPAKSAEDVPEEVRPEPLRATEEKSESSKGAEPEYKKYIQPPTVSQSAPAIQVETPASLTKAAPPIPAASPAPAAASQVKTEEKAVRPEGKPGSRKEHVVVVTSSHREIDIGQLLQEARVRKNLSIDQVAQRTKIKRDFIQALEDGDSSTLPARVFVEAYIKTLADTYGVSSSELLKPAHGKSQGKKVPDEILSSIEKGRQVNVNEVAKLNNMLKVAIVVIVLFLLLALIVSKLPERKGTASTVASPEDAPAVVIPKIGAPAPVAEPPQKITAGDLEIFVAPQRSFMMTELPVPEAKN